MRADCEDGLRATERVDALELVEEVREGLEGLVVLVRVRVRVTVTVTVTVRVRVRVTISVRVRVRVTLTSLPGIATVSSLRSTDSAQASIFSPG